MNAKNLGPAFLAFSISVGAVGMPLPKKVIQVNKLEQETGLRGDYLDSEFWKLPSISGRKSLALMTSFVVATGVITSGVLYKMGVAGAQSINGSQDSTQGNEIIGGGQGKTEIQNGGSRAGIGFDSQINGSIQSDTSTVVDQWLRNNSQNQTDVRTGGSQVVIDEGGYTWYNIPDGISNLTPGNFATEKGLTWECNGLKAFIPLTGGGEVRGIALWLGFGRAWESDILVKDAEALKDLGPHCMAGAINSTTVDIVNKIPNIPELRSAKIDNYRYSLSLNRQIMESMGITIANINGVELELYELDTVESEPVVETPIRNPIYDRPVRRPKK